MVGQGEGVVGFGVLRQVVDRILQIFCDVGGGQLRTGDYCSIGQEIKAGNGDLGLPNCVEGGVSIQGSDEIGRLQGVVCCKTGGKGGIEMNGFKFDGGIGDVIGKLVVPLVVVPDLVEDNLHFFVVGNDDADDNEIEQNKRGEGFESAFILILPVIVEKKAVEYVLDTAFPFLLHLFSLFFI